MLDKIFNKKKKDEDIFCVPERKNNIDFKNLSKLGPKALQEIVEQQEKYISVLSGRIQDIVNEYRKVKEKLSELQQKNDVINSQISRMSNEHEELTIKFDNLQNSLEVTIATNQQQLNSQLDFLRTQSNNLNSKQSIPKTIEQVFSMYQDRFALCSKITNQNKFLKEKINEIELKFDEIKERYEEVEKQKGFNNLIPSLMESLEELKKERKNQNLLSPEESQLHDQKNHSKKQLKPETKQMQTMTSENEMQIQKVLLPEEKVPQQCKQCIQLKHEIESLRDAKQSLLQDIGQWSEKCQNLQNDLNIVRAGNNEIEKNSQIILQEKMNLKDQLEKLKVDVKMRQQENKKLIQQYQSLQRDFSQQKVLNRNILKQLQQKSIQITVKQAQLGKMALQLAHSIKVDRQEKQQKAEKNQQQQAKEEVTSELLSYEEKVKELFAQNQQSLAQIQTLKQVVIGKSSEIMTLKQQIGKLLKQNNSLRQQGSIITQQNSTLQQQILTLRQQTTTLREKLSQQSTKINILTKSLLESQQLTVRLQESQKQQEQQSNQRQLETLSKITCLETKIGQTDKQLIFLRNNRQTIESDNKRMVKQKKLSQDAIKELQQYKNDVQKRILPQLRAQNDNLKKQFKQLSQQKQIMQQHNLQTVNSINATSQLLIKQIQQLKKDKSQLQGRLIEVTKQSQSRNMEIETFQQTINKLNRQMTEKMLAMDKLNNQCKKKQQQIEELCEQLKSKQRKYDGELNQQRIKAETMKRTISVQETKLQENEKSSNKFYEQSMHKDKKITYMEIKLKEYKHLIQSLKKEKDELEKAFNAKIKSYEDIIPEVVSEEELSTTQRKRSSETRQVSKSDGQLVEVHTNDKDTDYLKNQILSYEEANIVLKQENSHLREKIKQLQDESNQRKRQIYSLQEKRQQTLKEIEKLNIRSINGTLQPMTSQFSQKERQFIKEKQELLAEKQKSQQRIKKIASKAYKGFDILLKKHQTLYKDFIAVFMKQMNDREEVKNIEGEINLIINKTTDMKDVFQDYL